MEGQTQYDRTTRKPTFWVLVGPCCIGFPSSRIIKKIRRRPAPVKLVKKYSRELWNKWRADYEPNCTHTLHMEAFCKYVEYEMIKG